MRVLLYIHNLQIGGAEKIVSDYSVELKKKGIEIALLVNNLTDSFFERRVREHKIRIFTLNNPFYKKPVLGFFAKVYDKFIGRRIRINRIISNFQPDIIHINTLTDNIYGVRFPVDKMAFTFHSDVSRYLSTNSRRNRKCLEKMAKKGLWFFALTTKMKDDIFKVYNTDKIQIIPNAVSIESLKLSAYRKDCFLEQIGVPINSFVVCQIGRFDPVKNHEKTISVFKEIHKRIANSYLLLIGGDSGERINKIKSLANSFGLGDYVRFLGIREDAPHILGCVDCMILPSYSESFSIVMIEAQSMNIRCIASDRIPTDVICNDNCFALSLSESDDCWASMVLSKCTSKNERDIKEFDMPFVVAKIISSYLKMLGVQ